MTKGLGISPRAPRAGNPKNGFEKQATVTPGPARILSATKAMRFHQLNPIR